MDEDILLVREETRFRIAPIKTSFTTLLQLDVIFVVTRLVEKGISVPLPS